MVSVISHRQSRQVPGEQKAGSGLAVERDIKPPCPGLAPQFTLSHARVNTTDLCIPDCVVAAAPGCSLTGPFRLLGPRLEPSGAPGTEPSRTCSSC